MTPFTVHTGVSASLIRLNIDTDAIIPSREMKSVSKKGLSGGLFAGWRYLDAGDRTLNPDFVLNKPEQRNTSILLSGDNFGCGSSREHAVWALEEFGFRAIVCPSFGSIFYQNCVRNGIVPVVLPMENIHQLAEYAEQDPQQHQITIDLDAQRIESSQKEAGLSFDFYISSQHKTMLINGFDAIDLTLQHEASISEFEAQHWARQPWVPLSPQNV